MFLHNEVVLCLVVGLIFNRFYVKIANDGENVGNKTRK